MAVPARKCTICKKMKPEDQFKVRKGKYTNQCKDCINAQNRAHSYAPKAKEANRERQQRWVENNPEKRAEKIKKDTARERHKRGQ